MSGTSTRISFEPSPQLQAMAKTLVDKEVPERLTELDGLIAERMMEAVSNKIALKQIDFLNMLHRAEVSPISAEVVVMAKLIRDVASPDGSAFTVPPMQKTLESMRKWCEETKKKSQTMADLLDTTATHMAANIDLQVNRGLAAREIRALDEMLGNLTETQQFAEKLLAEIDKSQTHQVRLLKEKKNPPEGGKPMSF